MTAAVASTAAAPLGDAAAGKARLDEARCPECHGDDGNADNGDGVGNIGKFPKLAGQRADCIVKQFRNFRSGERQNETMTAMAASIGDDQLLDIAAYFSSLPHMGGDGAKAAAGRRLFAEGSAERGIPPCAGCHGPAGKSIQDGSAPVIGGQHKRYLKKQLVEWRVGERANSPGGVMNGVARRLTDEEIEALADYVSGL